MTNVIRTCREHELELLTKSGWALIGTYLLASERAHAEERSYTQAEIADARNGHYYVDPNSKKQLGTKYLPHTELVFVLMKMEGDVLERMTEELEAHKQLSQSATRNALALSNDLERLKKERDELETQCKNVRADRDRSVNLRQDAEARSIDLEKGIHAEREKVRKLTAEIGAARARELLGGAVAEDDES